MSDEFYNVSYEMYQSVRNLINHPKMKLPFQKLSNNYKMIFQVKLYEDYAFRQKP